MLRTAFPLAYETHTKKKKKEERGHLYCWKKKTRKAKGASPKKKKQKRVSAFVTACKIATLLYSLIQALLFFFVRSPSKRSSDSSHSSATQHGSQPLHQLVLLVLSCLTVAVRRASTTVAHFRTWQHPNVVPAACVDARNAGRGATTTVKATVAVRIGWQPGTGALYRGDGAGRCDGARPVGRGSSAVGGGVAADGLRALALLAVR